ncbi:MAG: alpha/beta hydrolase fold domain-containing protein [Aureibaculum sp.]|nr:alpha/beta hydrolase fold domain-containing protein [Aureibaculum sp.]
MEKRKNLIIQSQHQKPILTDTFYTQNGQAKPIVIFAHGFKGYKDWGCWNLVAEAFARQNLFFVKFNFSHNGGTKEQPIDFPDLEAFGNNNFIKELDDLQSVIDWVFREKSIQNEIDTSNITLIGHSRGGGIVALKASEDNRISKIITWAGVSDFEARFPKGEALALWRNQGVSYIENSRTKQQMPLYYQFYENFEQHKEQLHIQSAVNNLKIPYLILHGTNDTTVLFEEAKNLHSWNTKCELQLLEGANHTFGTTHPWVETFMPTHVQSIIEKSIVFVNNQNK